MKVGDNPLEPFAKLKVRGAKVEAKIDGQLQTLARLRLRLEEMQRPLEGCDSLAVGGARGRELTRPAPIGGRLARQAGLGEMVSDDLGLAFGYRREPLDQDIGDARMQLPTSALEQRAVGSVLYQRVLEGVDRVRRCSAPGNEAGTSQPF